MTTDLRGNRGFVLTFQAREQHIRRERATSNITTNQALMALAATIYLSLMGRSGLTRVAKLSYARAHLLNEKLARIGFRNLNTKSFNNELLGGVNLGEDNLLICCTEMNSIQDIEDFISAVNGE